MNTLNICKTVNIACATITLILGLTQSNIIILSVSAIGILAMIFQFFIERKNEKMSKLKDDANKISHLRAMTGNYPNSSLKSTSTYLQVLITKMSKNELKALLKDGFFDEEQKETLKNYIK